MTLTSLDIVKYTSDADGRCRVAWYNPKLDPFAQDTKMTASMRAAVRDGRYMDVDPDAEPSEQAAQVQRQGGPLLVPGVGRPPNLVSSLGDDGSHYPAIDIDHDIHVNSVGRPFPVTHEDRWTGGPCDHANRDHPVWWALYRLAVATGPGSFKLFASSTRGHWHLYMPNNGFQFDEYVGLLTGLVHDGLVEGAYLRHSIARGQTLLRPPWVAK